MATAARCLTLFPPSGAGRDAPGPPPGEEVGGAGPGVEGGWMVEGLAASGTADGEENTFS